MKKISHFLLLSIFLASCANVVTPIPNVTVTSQVTVTSAPTKTPAPTITPEPTATATKDPNAPPTFSRFINGVYYQDQTENGATVEYVWKAVPVSSEEKKNMWVTSLIDPEMRKLYPNGFPLIDQPDQKWGKQLMWVDLYEGQGVQARHLAHPHDPKIVGNVGTFSNIFMARLCEQYIKDKLGHKSTIQESKDFYIDWDNGKNFDLPIIDAHDNKQILHLNNQLRFVIYLVKPEVIQESDYETKSIKYSVAYENNVITITTSSPKPLDSLSDDDYVYVLLSGLMRLFVIKDQSEEAYEGKPGLWQIEGSLLDAAIHYKNPFIEILPKK